MISSVEAFTLLREAEANGILVSQDQVSQDGKIPSVVTTYAIRSGDGEKFLTVVKTKNGTLRGIEFEGERYGYG